MDNETKKYIYEAQEKLYRRIILAHENVVLHIKTLYAVVIILAIGQIVHGCATKEAKPTSQATLSDADIKALLDYGSRVNAMWNERTEEKKAEKLKNEAYERALKGEVGLLPGVEQ